MGIAVFPAPGGGVTQKVTEFTSSGSFTVPSNCSTVQVLVVGGGGAGGGVFSNSTNGQTNMCLGGGGGGGAVRQEIVPVTPGQTYTVTVGAGGSGSNGQANSTAGGNSSFGSLVIANGGGAGESLTGQTVGDTRYKANIAGATTGGASFFNPSFQWNAGNGGGAGGPANFVMNSNTSSISSYSDPNYAQPIPTQAGSGFASSSNINFSTAGIGVGIYGWGGCGASGYYGNNGGGTAGSPSYGIMQMTTNPFVRAGGSGVANTGSAGAGSASGANTSGGATGTGGNGGSGFVRVIYWS